MAGACRQQKHHGVEGRQLGTPRLRVGDALAQEVHVQKLAWLLEGASGIPQLASCGFALTVRRRQLSGIGPARKADVRVEAIAFHIERLPTCDELRGDGGDLISGNDDASSAA